MKYFFDTYALFEIVTHRPEYARFFEEEIITSSLNLGELSYGLLRERGKKTAQGWFDRMRHFLAPINEESVKNAMEFKFEHRGEKFSYIDCIGYQLAKDNKLMFLTGDREFEGIENVEFVK